MDLAELDQSLLGEVGVELDLVDLRGDAGIAEDIKDQGAVGVAEEI